MHAAIIAIPKISFDLFSWADSDNRLDTVIAEV